MRPLAPLVVVVVVVLIACNKPAPTAADAASSVVGSPCASTIAAYDAVVSSGGACASDADCVCFNGGVSKTTPCGGAIDKASAAKLEKLTKDYEAAKCDALMCAAMICTPACKAGRCVNEPAAAITTAPPPIPDAAAAASNPSWTACASDLDCTYVSLGCCDTTPVNRAHVADAKRKLEASGHPYCPPKSACGPSADGTWAGAPGKCSAGACVLRSM